MNLHIERVGSGAPLLLIHGWGMHSGVWEQVDQRLAVNYQVLCVDLPGYGHSKNEKWLATKSGNLLEGVVNELSDCFSEPLTVCGWSLGGQIAMHWAVREPAKVRRLILVASTPCFAERDNWSLGMERVVLEKFAVELEQNFVSTLRRFITLQIRGSENERELLALLREKLFSRGEPDMCALRAGMNILRDVDLRGELHDITQPTLVISGERDKLTPTEASRYLAQSISAAQLAAISGAAHAPFLSHPNVFVAAVNEFLESDV